MKHLDVSELKVHLAAQLGFATPSLGVCSPELLKSFPRRNPGGVVMLSSVSL